MKWEVKETPHSTRIREIRYMETTPDMGTLQVHFRDKNNSRYEYLNIPRIIWVKLYFANSVGKAFEELIKRNNYKGRRLQ